MYKTTDKHFKIYFVEGIYVLIDLLSNTGYIIVNKEIIKKIGLHEAILLGELCSEYIYWKKKDETVNEFFYSTRENIEENTGLSAYQQRTAISNLVKKDIIVMKSEGMPLKTWYFINENKLQELSIFNIFFLSSFLFFPISSPNFFIA